MKYLHYFLRLDPVSLGIAQIIPKTSPVRYSPLSRIHMDISRDVLQVTVGAYQTGLVPTLENWADSLTGFIKVH
jgi:hypothetical protein